MNIKKNILETIGHTPLVALSENLYAKIESFNPGGSVKDRVAYKMIQQALDEKRIDSNTLIIEPTSGNTGIGLAMVCASLHMKCMIVMPNTMSIERVKLMQAYGAEVVLTDGKLGMKGAIDEAKNLHEEISNSYIPQQFENPDNPLVHYETTGVEIMHDCDGLIDFFVSGIGTGGTISGVGKYLKEQNPAIQIIGVEPLESAVITTGNVGKHQIQGIGAGFIPKNLNQKVVDEVYTVSSEEAKKHARYLASHYGILAGISSGAAYAIAKQIASDTTKKVVVLLPDTGERYLSADLFG
ncbi:MAG: cysteine synthase A [Traorella sp.]